MITLKYMLKDEGIILQTLDFKDFDQIFTIFSLQSGIVKLVVKGAKRQKGLSALARVEFSYSKGSSDLWKCDNIAIVDAHLHLRNTLSSLEAGCEMVQGLLTTQMQNNPVPQLYILFVKSLEKISEMKDPYILSTAFLLKLMRHEGVFHLENKGQQFNEEETDLTNRLALCSHFSELKELSLNKEFRKKISKFFVENIGN